MANDKGEFIRLENPYTFGVPVRGVDKFFGREEELRIIFNTLEDVPRGQKQDLVIMGPRRIGKSSLLYRLVDLLTPKEQFVPVYVDVQNIKPRTTRLLFLKILDEIKEGYKQKAIAVDWPRFATLEPDNTPSDLEFFVFGKDMSRLNNLIASQNLPRLVLMFDEVELLWEFGGRDTLDWFRSLIQSMPYCVYVVAGSQHLYSLTQDYGSPFYNIFKTVELHPLSPDAARRLIEVPAADIGMKISPTEVENILQYTGNNPYFVQCIAHYLVETLNLHRRRNVRPGDIEQAMKQGAESFSSQFAYIWGGVSQVQRVVLYALAKSGQPQAADTLISSLPRSEILDTLVQSEQNKKDTFDDLVQQQILQAENNRYWFIVLLFVDWILSRVDDTEIIRSAAAAEVARPLEWSTEAIRSLLTSAFDDEEITVLVFDYFRSVYDEFSSGMSKRDKIQRLMEYCLRQAKMDVLLEKVRMHNPNQYARFESSLKQ